MKQIAVPLSVLAMLCACTAGCAGGISAAGSTGWDIHRQ